MKQIVFALCLLPFGLSWALPPFVINSEVIEPFSTPALDGFDDRIATEMYKRAGYQLLITRLPAERGLIMADRGIHDGILSRVGGVLQQRYPNLVQLDEPTFQRDFVAFSKQKDLKIESWDDLKDFNVGIITGWKILENNIKNAKTLTKVKGVPQLFRLIEEDRADVIIFARYSGLQKIKDFGITDLQVVGKPLATKDMTYYVHSRHKGLIPKLNESLRAIKEDGTWQQIYADTIGKLE